MPRNRNQTDTEALNPNSEHNGNENANLPSYFEAVQTGPGAVVIAQSPEDDIDEQNALKDDLPSYTDLNVHR